MLELELPAGLAQPPDVLIEDIEQGDYRDWKTPGTAFGTRPARGAQSGQKAVYGFEGKGLVKTFLDGDASTRTLKTPEYTNQRN